MPDFLFTLLELLGYFIAISLGLTLFLFVLAYMIYYIQEARAQRRAEQINKQYFKEIEEFRHDFS